MKKPIQPFRARASRLASLGIGCLCMAAAYGLYASFTPAVALRLAADGDRLALRLVNSGNKDIELAADGFGFFLFRPVDAPDDYLIVLENRNARPTTIRPGQEVDAGDVSPLLRELPPGRARLAAVYSVSASPERPRAFSGTVRSPVVAINIQ